MNKFAVSLAVGLNIFPSNLPIAIAQDVPGDAKPEPKKQYKEEFHPSFNNPKQVLGLQTYGQTRLNA